MKASKGPRTLTANEITQPSTTTGNMRIGINGFGRIGRLVARAALLRGDIDIAAINDPSLTAKDMVDMFRSDAFKREGKDYDISFEDNNTLLLGGKPVTVYAHKEPEEIPWANVGAEYVVESTGAFTAKEKAAAHLKGGAKKVIISEYSEDAQMFIMGVNEHEYKPELNIVSAAERTANCLAPLAKVIQDNFGIVNGCFTRFDSIVIQTAVDGLPSLERVPHITNPSSNGANVAVGNVVPALDGKLTEQVFLGSTLDVCYVELIVQLEKAVTLSQIINVIKEESEGKLKGILCYMENVSTKDLIWDNNSSIFNAQSAIVFSGNILKLVAITSNDWGYSMHVIDLIAHMAKTR